MKSISIGFIILAIKGDGIFPGLLKSKINPVYQQSWSTFLADKGLPERESLESPLLERLKELKPGVEHL